MKSPWPSPMVSPPSLWGKLPNHAAFVHHRVGFKEDVRWQEWLLRELGERALNARPLSRRARTPSIPWISLDRPVNKPGPGQVPIAFALPPGALHHDIAAHVIGVIARTEDRLGHVHPLIVYQFCSTRWLRQCFARPANVDHEVPLGWLYWLSRLTLLYIHPSTEPALPFHQAVDELWRSFTPHWLQRLGIVRQAPDAALLSQWLQTAKLPKPPEQDAMQLLHGVKHPPWQDWPDRLWQGHPKDHAQTLPHPVRREAVKSYWQHDAAGGYVGSSCQLTALWD